MINCTELKNFGSIEQLDWQNLGKINLIIGNNGCGKSFLLKALYSAVRTLEEYKRGETLETDSEILANKLHWTFQAEQIGDLVNKKATTPLSFKLSFDGNLFGYSFGKDTVKSISNLENKVTPRADNSIYLPAKEVLSLFNIIRESRRNKLFGFDDTYFDLVDALSKQYSGKSFFDIIDEQKKYKQILRMFENNDEYKKGSDYLVILENLEKKIKELEQEKHQLTQNSPSPSSSVFCECQEKLDNMLGGKIEYDYDKNRWQFKENAKNGNQKFSVGVMAEGIKKIAILDTLLGNGYLTQNSIVFIDEPESNLHPEAISKLLDIIAILANHGIQFFLASHSYFVIKKLFLIAQEQQMSIPVLSYQNDEWIPSDLKNDMPSNPIVQESIRLYKEEVFLASR